MNKSLPLSLLLALSLLTGCGARPAPDPLPEPPPPAVSPEAPAPAEAPVSAQPEAPVPAQPEAAPPSTGVPDLPEGDVAEGTTVAFTQNLPVTVDGGRELTLRLRCRAVASGYGTWDYGVETMEVLEGETLLQTLSVADGIRAADAAEGLDSDGGDGWTHCYEGLYLPTLEDLNFDGAGDIRLMEFLGTVNGRYLHWLWDPDAEQFVYGFCLAGYDFTVDAETEQLVTESRGSYGNYYTDTYAYDGNGVLRHVKEVHVSSEDAGGLHEVHELIDGQWVQTE